jgi:LysR family glycine cleavage system transcriptional activator
MQPRLPSLNALRAFEAAARHLSLTKAARELNVTPAAVSHQIKALEADLGVALLRRHKGTFVLSEVAQTALPVLRAGFDQIAEAARRLRVDHTRRLLTVSVWPEIDVRLDTTDDLADFQRDGVDVAIRFGRGDYPGLRTIRLFEEEIFPVCSPSLVEKGPPLDGPADIPRHTLLHVEWTPRSGETLDWETWLRAAGVEAADATRGLRFTHSSVALQAAIQGQGSALGSQSLASDELASGRLVRLFDLALPLGFAYHLVHPEETAAVPKVAAFADWVLAETGATSGPDA